MRAARRLDPEVVDERRRHLPRPGPCRVRRTDRLPDVLEPRRRAQHPPRAGLAPREVGILAREYIEGRQVFVETEHVRDRRAERPGVAIAAASGDELDQRVSIALP